MLSTDSVWEECIAKEPQDGMGLLEGASVHSLGSSFSLPEPLRLAGHVRFDLADDDLRKPS